MIPHTNLLLALLREDFSSFQRFAFGLLAPGRPFEPNWHHQALAYQLELVRSGDCKRLVINVPPRSLKSITTSVAYVAWRLGHEPDLKVFVVSHSAELARQHARDFRTIVESPQYWAAFPKMRVAKTGDRLFETVTTKGGFRLATSVGASVTGRGADLIILDDPNTAADAASEAARNKVNDYYDLTLANRLDDKRKGAFVIVSQRIHANDLTGHVVEQEPWTVLAIPAIESATRTYQLASDASYNRSAGELLHPARDSQEILERMRAVMGSMAFEAQYQQNPLPRDGNLIKREWLRYYDVAPEEFEFVVVSWDSATTLEEHSDYSVGTVWGLLRGSFYLLDVVRGRLEAPDLRRSIIDVDKRWNANQTIIEKANIGHALVQDLRRSSGLRPILRSVKFDKQSRMAAESAKFESGEVLLPREAPWLGGYLAELLAFPMGKHDDQVDSTSQALNYLATKRIRAASLRGGRPVGGVRPPSRFLQKGN